jgi:hypothetical protein
MALGEPETLVSLAVASPLDNLQGAATPLAKHGPFQ